MNELVSRARHENDRSSGDIVPIDALGLAALEELEMNRQRASALDIDIKAIWSAIYRNRFITLSILVLAVLGGVVSALLTTPIYRASASVQIDQAAAKVLESEDSDPAAGVADSERFLQTQLDVLQSRALAIKVADSLGLARNSQFLVAMGGSAGGGNIGGLDANGSRRERVIRTLQTHLTVQLPRNSRIANISFDSPDPALAARIANSFVDNFIMANLKRRFDTSAYTRTFLSDQLAEMKERLEQSERAMIDYARGARLIDTSSTAAKGEGASTSGQASLTTSNLVDLNGSYNAARAARIQAQQKWEQTESTPVMSMPEVLADPLIVRLKGDRSTAAAQLETDRARFGPNHPTIKQDQARLAELNGEITRQAAALRNSVREAYELAKRQEAALSANVSALTHDTLEEQNRGIQYNILRREVDTNRTMYDGLLQRYKEVSAASGITSNNVSVIDTAERPIAPISPNMKINVVLAVLAGLALAMLFTFVREKLDDIIRSPEDVDRKLGLPYLNAIPVTEPGVTVEEALENQRSHFSEAYFALRTALELASPAGLPRSLFFTSAAPAEGKSTTALALALAFAQVGRRTLLIDADLRKPSLHHRLGLNNDIGLSNVLAHHKSLDEAIQITGIDNLHALMSGRLPPNPAELLSGGHIQELFATLRDQYDLIILDGPPVLGLADAPALSSMVDATVFVIEANRSSRGKTKAGIRRLLAARAHIIGAVLTKFDAKRIGYGTDYGYYYYYYGTPGVTPADAPPKQLRSRWFGS